jgi:hypothetical protein
MNRQLRHFIFGIAVFASGTAMGNVTFFETENFGAKPTSSGGGTRSSRIPALRAHVVDSLRR